MPVLTSDNLLSYDTDDPADIYQLLLKKARPAGSMGPYPEVWPRQTVYGSPEAFEIGLVPLESVPDVLIQPSDYGDALKLAHEQKNMPIYHMQATWCPVGTKYTQDGLGYCWTWSGTGCMMTTRACEDKDTQLLAPVSMGYLVNWSNSGNYLESYIKGAREQGVCPAKDWAEVNSTNRSKNYWEEVNQRAKYRLDKVWDTRKSAMTQHCVSILCYGRSLYIAYNWWSHALEAVGIRMNGSTMEWLIHNSHNESDVIVLTGSKAIPDEAYGFISTVLYTGA